MFHGQRLDTQWTHEFCPPEGVSKFYPSWGAIFSHWILPTRRGHISPHQILPIKFLSYIISSATPECYLCCIHTLMESLHLNLQPPILPIQLNADVWNKLLLCDCLCSFHFFVHFLSMWTFWLSIFLWSGLKSIFGSFCPSFPSLDPLSRNPPVSQRAPAPLTPRPLPY